MDFAERIWTYLPYHLPFLILCLVAIVLSIIRFRVAPRTYTFSIIAFSIYFIGRITSFSLTAYGLSADTDRISEILTMSSDVSEVLLFVATLFVVISLFAKNKTIENRVEKPVINQFKTHEESMRPHRAATVLILGILSLSIFAPLGPVAWIMGKNDQKAMIAGEMDRSGETMNSVGQSLGIIGTIFLTVGMLGALSWLILL